MWSQNWQMYQKLILPFEEFNLDEAFDKLNWTSRAMVNRADDFYRSLNLPAMTKPFWQHSILKKLKIFVIVTELLLTCINPTILGNKSAFEKLSILHIIENICCFSLYSIWTDRMIVCAESTFDDLSVIVHEMGHLQYYMAFANQPPIFQVKNFFWELFLLPK